MAVPISSPLLSVTVTVLPASAVPVTVSADAVLTVGASGADASTVVVVSSLSFPVASVAVTVRVDPSDCAGDSVTL